MPLIGELGLQFSTGPSQKDQLLAALPTQPRNTIPSSLRVFVVREPFDEYFTIIEDHLKSGQALPKNHVYPTHELEMEDVVEWLMEHGANEKLALDTMNQAWNFYLSGCVIRNAKLQTHPFQPGDPLIP